MFEVLKLNAKLIIEDHGGNDFEIPHSGITKKIEEEEKKLKAMDWTNVLQLLFLLKSGIVQQQPRFF